MKFGVAVTKSGPPGRKPDPSFDMNVFRKAVAAAIKKL